MTWLKTGNAYKSQRGVFRFWGHQRWNFRKSKIFPTIGIFFWPNCATRYFFLKLGRVFQFLLKSYGHISHNYFFRFIRKKRRDFSENLRLINNISREITRQKWSYDECNVYVDKILMFLGGSNTNQSTGRAYWERDFRKISFFPRHYTFLLICSKETSNSNQKDPPLYLRHQKLVSLRFFTTGLFYITIA